MEQKAPAPAIAASYAFPLAALVVAIAIFVLDTVTHVGITFAVLYVGVVLIAARFCRTRGLALVAAACVALTVLSYVLSRGPGEKVIAGINDVLALSVIVLTAFLVARNQAAEAKALDAVQALQDQLRLVIDTIPTLVWTKLPDGSVDFLNQRFREYSGLSLEEGAGWGWMRTIHTEDRPRFEAEWRTAVASGTPPEIEARLRRADGQYRWFLNRAAPLRDEHGRIVKWYATNVDINDRKRAEAALREQAGLLDLSHDTIFVRDAHDVITYWNRGAEELYGWSREEAVGKASHQLVQTIFPAPLEEITAELGRTGRWEGELVHTKRDGTRVTVASRWSLQRDAQGRPAGVLETNNNITERKRAEEELRESESRYRHIFHRASVSIWEEDFSQVKAAIDELKAQGVRDLRQYIAAHPEFLQQAIAMVKVLDVNDATIRLFGAASKDELLVSLDRIFLPETEQVFAEELLALSEGRTSLQAETVVRTLQGKKLSVLFTIAFPPPLARLDSALVSILDITDRKRAVEEQRYHMLLLKTVTDNVSSMLYIIDAAGLGTFVNPSLERVTGYRAEELIGQLVHDKIHHTKPGGTPYPVSECPLTEAVRKGATVRGEDLFIRKDGTFFPVRYTASPVFREGVAVGTVIEAQDLTETKAAEDELRKRAALLNLAHDAIIVRDVESRIVFWNLGAEKTYGWTAQEAIGQVSHELLQTRFPASREDVDAALQEKGEWEGELTHITRQGTAMVVTSRQSLQRDEHGAAGTILEINRDVTERRQAEYLTQQMFESAPDSVAVVGRDYRYQRVNPIYERYCTMPAERIVGMHVADVVGIDVFEQTIKPNLDRCFAGEHVRYAEWLTNALGRFYLSVSYAPLRLGSERVEAALVITRDLTEHMLASEALREAQAALARVNRVTTLGVLAASIAHEVNQPLGAIVTSAASCSRWLAAQPPDFEKARRALERIGKDGRRASEVIDRIRTLVKRQAPRKDRIDINEAILEVIALTRDEVRRNEIWLESSLAEDLPLVEGDRIQLQQVILNLIVNAIEAMSTISERGRKLAISSAMDGPEAVRVEVRDSGTGVDLDGAHQLFEAFYTTKANGIGMGLSISRSIIEAHGGRLWVTPNVPYGAAFQFSLPVEQAVL